ncbi:hypothetical protein PAECIP111891_04318 [Paenibacillus allorhizoplanae]|uniref:6-hydroxymethylpterin diphosphokinase MptE-like domain-containing protein n=1 Tax=Paenibacillus allorhizoplanae TaxID=2905648 RepID=A0ABN8GR09_9BACL|nr:6-hydroxymethylpterin diphosphokinase MptE-like protein [Paenibacillus allorhizoplanae]CAH1215816.1 hypothetical protein PAECIP111891_04318 [Paenibacillus allorhizoplanae]
MIFEANLKILEKKFPMVWKARNAASVNRMSGIEIGVSKAGDPTLAININGKVTQVVSKYNPIDEAEQFINQLVDVDKYSNVLFYGYGMGYQVECFNQKYPNKSFSIFEPYPEIFYESLKHCSLKQSMINKLNHIYLEYTKDDLSNYLRHLVGSLEGELLLVVHPAYERLFSEMFQRFIQTYKVEISNKLENLRVNSAFEKRWIFNSLINLPVVIQTPNITVAMKERLRNKPVVLVAAGPSLDEEIENLRYIKENGLAYIISVGTAINGLLANDIFPDAACTYDPTDLNAKVFQVLVDKGITNLPLIFGTSTGFEVIQNYPGPKLHMLTSQDTISPFFLQEKQGKAIYKIADAGSVSIIALQLLKLLECNPVILVAQNFAFKKDRTYADSTLVIEDFTQLKPIKVESVTGEDVYTNEDWNRMRKQMEIITGDNKHLEVINTTSGGAKIANTEYISLKEVIQERLSGVVVEEGWYATNESSYDLTDLDVKMKRMALSCRTLLKNIDDIVEMLKKLERAIARRDLPKMNELFPKLDKDMNKVSKNDFFNILVLPMNRVKYEFFMKKIDEIRKELNVLIKAKLILTEFGDFLYRTQHDALVLQPIYKATFDSMGTR